MISVTDLSSYEYCKRKLFLEKVLHVAKPPKDVLVLGSIRHNAYDSINKEEEKLVRAIAENQSKDNIIHIFESNYENILLSAISTNIKRLDELNLISEEIFKRFWPSIQNQACERALQIHGYVEQGLFGDALWEGLCPKILSEYMIISESLRLKGYVDRIENYKDRIIPIELKTGSAPKDGAWPGHKIQVGAYALLIEDKLQNHIPEAIVRYLDIKKDVIVPINQFLRMEVTDLIEKTHVLISSEQAPKYCENKNKCSSCAISALCHDTKFIKEQESLIPK